MRVNKLIAFFKCQNGLSRHSSPLLEKLSRSDGGRVRSGFTLIEMMIVLMLSAIIIGIMLSSYGQLQKATRRFDSRVDLESSILAIASLFERDVSGACIPLQSYQAEKEKRAEESRKKQDQNSATQSSQQKGGAKPSPNNAPKQGDEKESQQKTPEVKAIFYAEKGEKDITNLFTCITNNPLDIYWSEGAGRAKPKIARVVFRLKKNERAAQAPYSLWRQEGPDFDYPSYTKSDSQYRQYLVSDMISKFALTFYSHKTDKEGKTQEEVSKLEYGSNQEVSLELPQLVTLDITAYDPRQKRSQSFSMTYRVWGQPIKIEESASTKATAGQGSQSGDKDENKGKPRPQ